MIKTILAEVKSEKDCSEILKDLIVSAEKDETIFHLPKWGNIYPKEKLVDAIAKTKLVTVDSRHIDENTFALKSQVFWEVVYDPDSPNAYAHSQNRQPLHTDNGWFSSPPEISFFIMEKQAPKGGESTYYSFSDVIQDLENKNRALFNKLASIEVTIQKTETEKNITKIIDLEKRKINWNFYRIKKEDEEIKLLCDEFFQFLELQEIEGKVKKFLFESGDCYILPDQKFLHGREMFSASKKGDRKLLHSQWKYI